MDLSSLNQTLPPDLADAERDMGDKFRGASTAPSFSLPCNPFLLPLIAQLKLTAVIAAALSITNLYKSSLSYTKVCAVASLTHAVPLTESTTA